MFNLDEDKVPGQDGFFMSFFYHECCDIVKSDLLKVVEEFYDQGSICKGINSTY